MIKAVLFDFHNTLATCDSWLDLEIRTLPARVIEGLVKSAVLPDGVLARCPEAEERFKVLRQRVRSSGLEISAVEGTRRVFLEMGLIVSDNEIESAVAQLEEACLHEVEIVEGAWEALIALRADGFRMAIVSSAGYPPFVEMALEKLGLRAFFSAVITSAGEGIYKSDPEIFRRALGRLDVQPEEAVHVGDHPVYDVQVAKAAGLSTIWFTAHSERTAHMHGTPWEKAAIGGAEADNVISSLDQLRDAIEQL